MLSSEGSRLTSLILKRHTLICRAIQLDTRFEILALLDGTPEGDSQCAAATDSREMLSDSRTRICAELMSLPARIDELDTHIESAWHRLDRVSPRMSG